MDKNKANNYRGGSTQAADKKGEVIPTFSGMNAEKISSVFSHYEGMIGQLVSKQLQERFVQIAITMVAKNDMVRECTQESVLGAFLSAAMYELEILPNFGHCYFVPYRNNKKDGVKELQFQIGYQGYAELMIRGGAKDVFGQEVYKNDLFSVDWAQEIPIIHKPLLDGDRGKLAFVWGRVINAQDVKKFDWMNEEAVHKRRKVSKSAFKNGKVVGIWKDWTAEMWLKTIIHKMKKLVPLKSKVGEPDVQTLMLADGGVITTKRLGAGGKIDLSGVAFPDQEEEPTPVNIPSSDTPGTQEPQFKAEDENQGDPTPDQLPINASQIKILIDAMKENKIEKLMDYVKNWEITELSASKITVSQLKGILYDLGAKKDKNDPEFYLTKAFFLPEGKEKTNESFGTEKETSEAVKGADHGDRERVQEEIKEATEAKKTPAYDVNDIRKTFKTKSQALEGKGCFNIGELIGGFGVKTLTQTDCGYDKFVEISEYLNAMPNNKLEKKDG